MADPYWDTLETISARAGRQSQNALAQRAGAMVAAGDLTGGQNELLRGGDFANANVLGVQQANQRKQQAEAVEKFTTGVGRLITERKMDPQTAWQIGEHFGQQLGMDAGSLAKLKEEYDQDPQGFLALYNNQAKKELQVRQSGRHVVGLDPTTGKEAWTYDLPQDPARAQGVPQGFRVNEETGDLEIDPGYLSGKAALAKATRAPPRGRSGGGGRASSYSGLPPGYRPK